MTGPDVGAQQETDDRADVAASPSEWVDASPARRVERHEACALDQGESLVD